MMCRISRTSRRCRRGPGSRSVVHIEYLEDVEDLSRRGRR